MSEAVYVRFSENELSFINNISKEKNISRSETIKNLVDYAAKKLKIEKAIDDYKNGKCTIRECAEISGLRYFEFFDILAKENLIGTNPDNIDLYFNNLK